MEFFFNELFNELWKDSLGWFIVVALLVVGMLGAVFPVLPGVFAIFIGFVVYGLFFGFFPLDATFWIIQTILLIIIVVAEYVITSVAVKRSGGSRASVTGTNVGLILGPFLIPMFGIILGPFLGSLLGEMNTSKDVRHLLKVGFGSLVGFFISVIFKLVFQSIMIGLFVWYIIYKQSVL